jgi:hypothetical protein
MQWCMHVVFNISPCSSGPVELNGSLFATTMAGLKVNTVGSAYVGPI